MQLVDRRTGKLVEVPEDRVAGAFKSGMYGLPKGAQMPVATPGLVGTVAPSEATQAFDTGSRVPTEAEFRQAQQQARYGGIGGAAAAAGVGAARGAAEAFGVPLDAALVGLAEGPGQVAFHGRDEVDPYRGARHVSAADVLREDLTGLKEQHGIASTLGELGGMAAGQAVGGGLLGGAGRAGEAAAGIIGRGAAEGAVLGGVNAVNESALGDAELNGSKLVAGMGEGALFGGALGTAFHGLGIAAGEARAAGGRFLARLAPSDVEQLAEKTFGYAPEGLGQKVQRFYSKAASAISGKDAETISKFTELSPEGAEARRIAVFDAPKIQEEAQRTIRTSLDDMLRSGDLVTAEARGGLKADYVAKAVRRSGFDEQAAFAEKQLGGLIEGVDGQLAHADGVAPQMVKPLETVSRAAYHAQAALASGDSAKLFVELDNVKRAVQKLTNTGYRSVANIADPLEQLQARRTVDWMRGAAEDLRGSLEREDLWGKAAADQREINAAWTKQIDASQRFHRALTTETARDPNNPYVRVKGADPAKVAGYVKNLTNPNNDLTHQAVRDYVASTDELAKAIGRSYDLPAEKSAEVLRVAGAAKQFGQTISKAEKSLVLANQYEALTRGTSDSLAGLASSIGFAAGGLPGGALGSLVGAVAHPGKVVAQLAAVERMMTKVDARIGSSIRGFLKGRGGARPVLHEAATPEGFDKVTKLLSKAVDADGNVTEAGMARIGETLGELPDNAPNTARAASQTMLRILTYLASKLPPAMRDPADMFPGDEPPLTSDSEREQFARYFTGATDPASVFEHLEHGSVTPEEVEALKACHAPLFEEAGRKLHDEVFEAAAKGKPIDYQRRVTMGVLFEQPTDATMSLPVLGAVARAQQSAPTPPAQPAGKHRGRGSSGGGGFIRAAGAKGTIAPRFMTTFEAATSRRKGAI